MNKIFSDSLKDLEKVLDGQKLENQAKFFVSFEFMQTDYEKDLFGPYRRYAIFREFSGEVTEFTIKDWIKQIEMRFTDSSRKCIKATILFFKEIS